MAAVLVALFLRAVGTAFHQPCLQAVTPLIVPAPELTRMNGYTASLQSISYIASPALAAALYAVLPVGTILLTDVIGAVAGIATVAMSVIPRLADVQQGPVRVVREAMDGLRELRRHKGLFWMVITSAVFSIAYVPVSSLFPLMTMNHFGRTAASAGIVEMLFAAGMLIGGLVLGVWGGSKNRLIPMIFAILLLGSMTVVSGLLPPAASGCLWARHSWLDFPDRSTPRRLWRCCKKKSRRNISAGLWASQGL